MKKAANTKGQPWIVLKLMVPLTVGIMGYVAYVYIGRFCLDMINEPEGSRATGSECCTPCSTTLRCLLICASRSCVSCRLCYTPSMDGVGVYQGGLLLGDPMPSILTRSSLQVVVTSPGYAKDVCSFSVSQFICVLLSLFPQYILKSSRPMFPDPPQPVYNPNEYDPEHPYPSSSQPPSPSRGVFPEDPDRVHDPQTVGGPAYEHIDIHSYQKRAGGGSPVTTTSARKYTDPQQKQARLNAGVLDALPLPTASTPATEDESMGHDEGAQLRPSRSVLKRQKKPSVYVARRPPQTPQLLPAHRYCGLDEIVKPYRTHHCRTCGTVRIYCLVYGRDDVDVRFAVRLEV